MPRGNWSHNFFGSIYVLNADLNGEKRCVAACDTALQITKYLTATTSVCVAKANCTGTVWQQAAAGSSLYTCAAAPAVFSPTNTMLNQTLILVEDTLKKIYKQSTSCGTVWKSTNTPTKDGEQESAVYTCVASCTGTQIKAMMSTVASTPKICLEYQYRTY